MRNPSDSPTSPTPFSLGLGGVPQGTAEERRFTQERLTFLYRVAFLISAMFLVVDTLRQLAGADKGILLVGRLSHAAATAICLAMWLGLRGRREVPASTLHVLDALAILGVSLGFALMGRMAPQPYGFYTAMLAVTHVSISRAMLVPTTPHKTFTVGLLGFGSFVVLAALGSRAYLVEIALWSIAGVTVTTVCSRVAHGLRTRARQALQLGQYTLEDKIGHGGMGEIYRARHAMLRRPTAIKLLSDAGSEESLSRFEKEVQLTARLTHPNTISVYDYGRTPDGLFYYAMELLEGMTLEQLVRQHGPLPPPRAIHLLLQVCGALAEAHSVGLVHRDIKPANLFLCRQGGIPDFIKVLDFGLVQEVDAMRGDDTRVAGTPLYMSPEAILEPGAVDARTDVYSLGAVAYFLVTGTVPFQAATAVEAYARQVNDKPARPSTHTEVPADLEDVILHCLQKGKELRPQGAAALARELEACVDAGRWSAREAERWWQALPAARSTISFEPTVPLGTIVPADLERRV